MNIKDFTKPELDFFREQCNFVGIENDLFELRSQGVPLEQIAEMLDVSIDAEEGYSEGMYMRRNAYNMGDGSYRGDSYGSYGDSYRGYSTRRGRGRNARRDSMGRYARANDMMVDELREMMENAPDEQSRMEIERLINKMEQR